MTQVRKVAIVVGSLRKESLSRKLATAITVLAPANLAFEFVDIGQLVKAADAVLFVTPEYNRSVPGVLKNAIDVGSRPYGSSVWNGKPAAVVSNSPGAIGGFGAYHHLRQTLVFLNMPTVNQPETYIGHVATLFGENGELTNEATREFLTGFTKVFADLIEKHSG